MSPLPALGLTSNGCPPLHIPYKDWSGDRREQENYLAIERHINNPCGGCSCYVNHRETEPFGQTIASQGAPGGYRADVVQIVWYTNNECGTLTDPDAMLVLTLNWTWQAGTVPPEPVISAPAPNTGVPFAMFVGVYAQGLGPPGNYPIARDTRLGLGGQWAYVNGDVDDGGSLSIPLNIFPAGQGFEVWVAQNSEQDKTIQMRADLYTVCGCSCVL